MVDSTEYPELYLQGIVHFNECDFYESHEVWEALWTDYQGPSRKFYQGLIQAAVALHHFGNGNIRGARKLYYSTRSYLEPYRPWHMGLDLEQFLAQLYVLPGIRATRSFVVLSTYLERPVQPTVTTEWPEIPLSPA